MKKVVVIGSGLTGLWISKKLKDHGREVTLLESREVAGGRYRRARESTPFESPDLNFFPGDEAHQEILKRLSKDQPDFFDWTIEPHQSLTHSHSEWRSFIGFGNDPADSVDQLSQWNVATSLEFKPMGAQIVAQILEDPQFQIRLRTEVTNIQVEEGRVKSITINGSSELEADEFVFCPSPSRLLELVSREGLKSTTRSRLARATGWTAIFLRLDHAEEFSKDRSLRFLLGTGKDLEPAVGRIFEDHSIWMSLVSAEKALEPDYVTGQIKAIKRVLKRHLPEVLEKTSMEHIFIQNEAYGALDLKTKSPTKFNEISNLWIANHRTSPLMGTLAELDSAVAIISELFVAEPQSPVLTEQQL